MSRLLSVAICVICASCGQVRAADSFNGKAEAAIQIGALDIARQVHQQHKESKRIAPDRDLVQAVLRLEMRRNVASLRSMSGFYRRYPLDKHFDRSAFTAERRIQDHVASLKSEKDLAPAALAKKIAEILSEVTTNMVGFMPMSLSRSAPDLPELDPAEKALLSKVPSPPGA